MMRNAQIPLSRRNGRTLLVAALMSGLVAAGTTAGVSANPTSNDIDTAFPERVILNPTAVLRFNRV